MFEKIISLIQIRSFLKEILEDISVSLSKEEQNKCVAKISELNKALLDEVLDLDVSSITEETLVWSRTSTEDPTQVLAKFIQAATIDENSK